MKRAGALGVAVCLLGFLACVGDDPATSGPVNPNAEGGTDGNPTNPEGGGGPDGSDGAAIDTQTDPKNCGTLGNACAPDSGGCFRGVCGNVPTGLTVANTDGFACVVLTNGGVACWGVNDHGQLGNSDSAKLVRDRPTRIVKDSSGVAFDSVVEVVAGHQHACARKKDGSVWCWGNNAYSQAGSAARIDQIAPTRVGTLTGYTSIAAAGHTTCGIDASQQVYCWGSNDRGQLGHPKGTAPDADCGPASELKCAGPTLVPGTGPVAEVTLGFSHALGRASNGSVLFWGGTQYGQDASGVSGSDRGVSVITTPNAKHVYSGNNTGCVLGNDDALTCWGLNNGGSLGHPEPPCPGPAFCLGTVEGKARWGTIADVIMASPSQSHQCVVAASGTYCSGNNQVGECGVGFNGGFETGGAIDTPTKIKGPGGAATLADVVEIRTGNVSTCARTKAGKIYCWGDNGAGSLGVGLPPGQNTNLPVAVIGL